MPKPQVTNGTSLALLGSPVLSIVALLWAVALLGSGIWFIQRSPGLSTGAEHLEPESFAEVKNVPTGIFNYSATAVWAPIRLGVDSLMEAERKREFRLRYLQPTQKTASSRRVIQMLLNDELSWSVSDRPLLDEEYRQAQARGFKLRQIAVAIDGIAVAVNPDLDIPGLTLEQLRSIYSSEVTNWQQLGGPNLKIVPLSPKQSSGAALLFFQEQVLADDPFGWTVKFVSNSTQALSKLTETPGAIYYGSAAEIVPDCSIKTLPLGYTSKQLVSPQSQESASACPKSRHRVNMEALRTRKYPLTRYLYVVVKENGDIDQKAGIAYANLLLTKQGHKAIALAGLVPIR
ncbi:MAG: substrate-binding domain-containing protein [Nostocaceae cyanobacterium]|nr:substrate-binding domain-containing protein [Nostocaceae cyanobacterium]